MKHIIWAVCASLVLSFSGYVHADYLEGMEYYHEGDYKRAFRVFNADEDSRAAYMAGIMYENGEGLDADKGEAAKCYLRSAEKGNAGAQYRLGHLYQRGLGVEQNKEEALKWYKLAAKQGHQLAIRALKMLEQEQ